MSDTLVAKGSNSVSHPEGQYVGRCVDCIDLGEKVEEYQGNKSIAQKCALVFRTGEKNPETGYYIDISKEFTVSMGDKANLRKFLEQWRGKPYTADQIKEGVPLHKLTGNYGLLTISQKVSGSGKTYANITACVGVPKQMADRLPEFEDYERAEFWEKRKKEYATAAQVFKGVTAAKQDDEGFPPALEDGDDDLPF